MDVYENLEKAGLSLPRVKGTAGVFTLTREFSSGLVYSAGCGPDINGAPYKRGKLGREVSLEEGRGAARNCMLNILAALEAEVGDLGRIKRVVKLLVFVSSDGDFILQPRVADAASQLLIDILGEEVGMAARSAIGVAVLPGDIPVEIEALFEIER